MIIVKSLAIVLTTLSFLSAQNPLIMIDEAKEKFNNKEFRAAEQQLNEILTIDPTFAPANFYLGKIYLRFGEMKKVKENYSTAIELDAQNTEYRDEYNLVNEINQMMAEGNRLMRSGDLEEAYAAFSRVLDKFPFFTLAAYNQGGLKIRQKDFPGAIERFNAALAINPEFNNARAAIATVVKNTFNEGNNVYRLGDLGGALEKYKQVVEYDPNFFQAYYQIGVISSRLGDIDVAIENYKMALEITPNFSKGWYALGLTHKKIGEIEEALAAFQNALNADPNYSKAYAAMGEIYLDQQNFEAALDRFQIAVSVDPTYAKGYENLGITYTKIEDWEAAIVQLQQTVALNPESLNGWYHLAMSYNQIGDCENALNSARNATDIRGNHAPALIELGVAYYCNGHGDRTRALNALEKARNDSQWRRVAEYEIDRINNPERYED